MCNTNNIFFKIEKQTQKHIWNYFRHSLLEKHLFTNLRVNNKFKLGMHNTIIWFQLSWVQPTTRRRVWFGPACHETARVIWSSLPRDGAPPNQKNIYDTALALIAIMYGIMQGIIAIASLLATMALYGNGRDPQ